MTGKNQHKKPKGGKKTLIRIVQIHHFFFPSKGPHARKTSVLWQTEDAFVGGGVGIKQATKGGREGGLNFQTEVFVLAGEQA